MSVPMNLQLIRNTYYMSPWGAAMVTDSVYFVRANTAEIKIFFTSI
jgi:hypothetical protein